MTQSPSRSYVLWDGLVRELSQGAPLRVRLCVDCIYTGELRAMLQECLFGRLVGMSGLGKPHCLGKSGSCCPAWSDNLPVGVKGTQNYPDCILLIAGSCVCLVEPTATPILDS